MRRGFQIFTWRQDGVGTWVISDLNAGDLQRFSETLAKAGEVDGTAGTGPRMPG